MLAFETDSRVASGENFDGTTFERDIYTELPVMSKENVTLKRVYCFDAAHVALQPTKPSGPKTLSAVTSFESLVRLSPQRQYPEKTGKFSNIPHIFHPKLTTTAEGKLQYHGPYKVLSWQMAHIHRNVIIADPCDVTVKKSRFKTSLIWLKFKPGILDFESSTKDSFLELRENLRKIYKCEALIWAHSKENPDECALIISLSSPSLVIIAPLPSRLL